MNNGFWTSFVKGLNKVVLVIEIIGFMIYGINVARVSEILGLVIIFVGILVAFMNVSTIMMIAEMSDKLSDMSFHLSRLNNNPSNPGTANRNQFTANNPHVNAAANSTTWECPDCSSINSATSRFCQTCGYQKTK